MKWLDVILIRTQITYNLSYMYAWQNTQIFNSICISFINIFSSVVDLIAWLAAEAKQLNLRK